jgi:hypothetical protein
MLAMVSLSVSLTLNRPAGSLGESAMGLATMATKLLPKRRVHDGAVDE